jgi:hypothetical protein
MVIDNYDLATIADQPFETQSKALEAILWKWIDTADIAKLELGNGKTPRQQLRLLECTWCKGVKAATILGRKYLGYREESTKPEPLPGQEVLNNITENWRRAAQYERKDPRKNKGES